ncbi:hypothetical protein H2198_005863 [Neophaeococcomyces mojaviensis]|uniref:Uncharacterized protein n=1 Tax=Neophaeococcomyces mojaviensis TaxID=3383035 RepID=A0ACC3A4K4_9EURO|nr:hypothetical protein H2198_005863 [Knufia sp. JES_112]
MASSAPATNGNRTASDFLTELSVGSEVDKILNDIKVNDFMKDTKPSKPPLSNGVSAQEIPPVTSILASFISSARPSLLTPSLRAKLHEVILDYIAVTAAGATIAPSTEPIFNGILAFTGLPAAAPHYATSNGTTSTGCTTITRGQTYPPQYAALLNATFGHSLDFDDTHAISSLHAGVTAIPAALACFESLALSPSQSSSPPTSDDLLLAISLAYETTIRIGVALSTASYSRGFHNTSVAGIFGSIAAIASLKKLSASAIANAFGLAGSKAAGSMQYLANGSWNKRLHPGFACHDAFLCVSLAEAGVIGAEKIIEGELGVLQAYTDRERSDVDWQRLIAGLGQKWEWEDSALKPYAGCRMTHAFIELSDHIGKEIREGKFESKKVRKVVCTMPKANMILVGQKTKNKVRPENMVDAQFSCYFQVANALCYGGTHDMAAYDRLQDPLIGVMAQRIECRVDESMGGMSARMEVVLENEEGSNSEVVKREQLEPLGEVSHPFVRELVEEKFLSLMAPVYGESRSKKVMECVYGIGKTKAESVRELLDLIAWPQK